MLRSSTLRTPGQVCESDVSTGVLVPVGLIAQLHHAVAATQQGIEVDAAFWTTGRPRLEFLQDRLVEQSARELHNSRPGLIDNAWFHLSKGRFKVNELIALEKFAECDRSFAWNHCTCW